MEIISTGSVVPTSMFCARTCVLILLQNQFEVEYAISILYREVRDTGGDAARRPRSAGGA